MDTLDARLAGTSVESAARGRPYARRRRWVVVALCCAFIAAGMAVAVLFLLSGGPASASAGHGMG